MKKLTIIFTIVLGLIIPTLSAKALIGNDGTEFPDKPSDGYNNYFIYYRNWDGINGNFLVSYDDVGTYLSSGYFNLNSNYGTCIDIYKDPPFNDSTGSSPSISSPNHDVPFKKYKLVNGNWILDLERNTRASFCAIDKVLYSTKDIYYRTDNAQSTYPSDIGFISGTYMVTLSGIEGAYQFKTYSADKVVVPEIKPSFTIDISYLTNIEDNIPSASIKVNYNNYDSLFKYQYSFNGKDWTNIEVEDVKNNIFNISTYLNGTFYTRILDINGVVVKEESKLINSIMTSDNMFTYELPISSFYDKALNQIKYTYFFYDNDIKNPYFGFKKNGSSISELPVSLIYYDNIIDKNAFLSHLKFSEVFPVSFPSEFKNFRKENSSTYKSYNAFVFFPCIADGNTFLNYTTEKIIIKTNVRITLSPFVGIEEVLKPVDPNVSSNEVNIILKLVNKIFNPIIEKLPIINQLKLIISELSFPYDEGVGVIPEFKVDLNFLKIDKQLNIIDFSYFLQYRTYIFAFEKLFLGFYTFLALLKETKSAIGGGI